MNAYKCVNVVCAGATRSNLQRLVEKHFLPPRSCCNFAPPIKKNPTPRAVYIYSVVAAPKYAEAIEALRGQTPRSVDAF
jgi:hypothetical protein